MALGSSMCRSCFSGQFEHRRIASHCWLVIPSHSVHRAAQAVTYVRRVSTPPLLCLQAKGQFSQRPEGACGRTHAATPLPELR